MTPSCTWDLPATQEAVFLFFFIRCELVLLQGYERHFFIKVEPSVQKNYPSFLILLLLLCCVAVLQTSK